MWGELHEQKSIKLVFNEPVDEFTGYAKFKSLGAKREHDLYIFNAKNREEWQTENLVSIRQKFEGKIVYSYDIFDELTINFLLAHSPVHDQDNALDLIDSICAAFEGVATYKGFAYDRKTVQQDWKSCTKFLWREWAEVPGNRSLAVMVQENYQK